MSETAKRQIREHVQRLKEKGFADGTVKRIRSILGYFAKNGFSRQSVERFQEEREWFRASTKKTQFHIVKQFVRVYYPKLIKYIEIPKVPEELPRQIPSEDEVKIILSQPDITTFNGIRDRVILELFYGSGIRLSELTNIKLEDLDLEKGIVRVVQGKNKKDRMVPMSKAGTQWVQKYVGKVRAYYEPKENYLIVGKWGGRMYPKYPGEIVKKYGEYSPHKYRHGFATHLLKGGMKETSLQRLLGHSQVTTTQIYTKVTVQDLQQSYRRYHPRDGWKK